MCIYIIYACSLRKTNTTIRWYYIPCNKQVNEVGALLYQDIKVINMHDNNTKQISSHMLTYMVEHGLLLVPFMNECKTHGVCPYVQLWNSPKIMKSESHHVWKLLYSTLYIIDVCVRPLKIQHIGLSQCYYVCKQTTTIGRAFWSQDIKVTTMHHTLNNKHLQNYWYWYMHIVVLASSPDTLWTHVICTRCGWKAQNAHVTWPKLCMGSTKMCLGITSRCIIFEQAKGQSGIKRSRSTFVLPGLQNNKYVHI
jgi:hypothetical protein